SSGSCRASCSAITRPWTRFWRASQSWKKGKREAGETRGREGENRVREHAVACREARSKEGHGRAPARDRGRRGGREGAAKRGGGDSHLGRAAGRHDRRRLPASRRSAAAAVARAPHESRGRPLDGAAERLERHHRSRDDAGGTGRRSRGREGGQL